MTTPARTPNAAPSDPVRPPAPPGHTLNPTARFSDRAADYVRGRPGYPPEVFAAMIEGMGEASALVGADIGAGTGISARLLADTGVRVIAVEPNAAMRAAAEPHPRVGWHDGNAERTGLAQGSVNLVLAAQAFHWFRQGEALAEFSRILRPSGRVALLWNDRDETDPATAEYTRLIDEASTADSAAAIDIRQPTALRESPLFTDFRERIFPYRHALTDEALLSRALSASYVPREGPKRDALAAALRALHRAHADGSGLMWMSYRTALYLADARAVTPHPAATSP